MAFKRLPSALRTVTRTWPKLPCIRPFSSTHTPKSQQVKSLPASFVRGGTSNGLLIHSKNLPKETSRWQPILSNIMGSPDPTGRQLNGLGGGYSSTSKIIMVSPPTQDDIDLDYTFVQVGIKEGDLDMAGNCGNMSSAVVPFGIDEGLITGGKARIYNINTKKVIEVTCSTTESGEYNPLGDYSIDGVPGTGSRITMAFLDPGGAKTGKALPTGNAVDILEFEDGSEIQASLIDVANPGVFVRAEDIGIPGDIEPSSLEADTAVMARLEHIRRLGAQRMGLDPDVQSIPKIVILSRPTEGQAAEGVHIVCRALSMQQPHKAVPLTLALNLGANVRIPGTLAAETAVDAEGFESITIAHPSGKVQVGSVFEGGQIKSALLHRTARIMMKGEVLYAADAPDA